MKPSSESSLIQVPRIWPAIYEDMAARIPQSILKKAAMKLGLSAWQLQGDRLEHKTLAVLKDVAAFGVGLGGRTSAQLYASGKPNFDTPDEPGEMQPRNEQDDLERLLAGMAEARFRLLEFDTEGRDLITGEKFPLIGVEEAAQSGDCLAGWFMPYRGRLMASFGLLSLPANRLPELMIGIAFHYPQAAGNLPSLDKLDGPRRERFAQLTLRLILGGRFHH